MAEAPRHQLVDHALAGVSERRVPDVVTERDRLGQLLVQPKHLCDGARDLGDLQRVGEPRAVVVAGGREEDLCLVFQAAERLAVDDAIAIVLERWPHVVFGLGLEPAARFGALGGLRRERVALPLLERLTNARQQSAPGSSCRAAAGPCRNWPPASGPGRRRYGGARGPRRPRRGPRAPRGGRPRARG